MKNIKNIEQTTSSGCFLKVSSCVHIYNTSNWMYCTELSSDVRVTVTC